MTRGDFLCARGLPSFQADIVSFIQKTSKLENSVVCRGPRTTPLGLQGTSVQRRGSVLAL